MGWKNSRKMFERFTFFLNLNILSKNTMDFTNSNYIKLLNTLQSQGFSFQTLEEFILQPKEKVVIMRHDVDRKPYNALKMAQIEKELSVSASYYFRTVEGVYNEEVINQIKMLGHEVGYHYENMDTCNGNYEDAYSDFCKNLKKLKEFYPVQTFCMHGSPMSRFDNKDLWKKYNYKELGLIAEPYFDIDFNKVFYITDASRAWNNENVSVRDKVTTTYKIKINSTQDIINLALSNKMPAQIMINIHPHNWAKNHLEWAKVLLWQGIKNTIKRLVILVK